jgi:polysaccharide biosynthesis protein PslH
MKPPARAEALFLAPEKPVAGTGGGALRSLCLLEYLRRNYQPEIVTFHLREHSKSTAARAWRNASRLIRGRPPLVDRFSGYEEQIAAALRRPHYELGIVEHFWCASYAGMLRPRCTRLVLDLHNIESALSHTHAQATGGAAGWAFSRFARLYAELEKAWLPLYDTILVASDEDRRRVHHPDVRIFPNALPEIPLPRVGEEAAIVFSGNLEYHPNIEAVRWFRSKIWPLLRNMDWRLVGRNADAIRTLIADDPRIHVVGPVEDAVVELAKARVCVVPLLSGSGTRFKILEAWAAGRAVVSTSIGAEGLGAVHGEHLWIADDAASFAEAITRLWDDPAMRRRMGDAGRALYMERFTWNAAWRSLDDSGGL